MLHQKLLTGNHPYFLNVIHTPGFEEHRHPELELNYCLKGSCNFRIDKKDYELQEGDLVIIGSMVAHEIPKPQTPDNHILTVEVGPVFLMGYFELFSKAIFHKTLYHLKNTENQIAIYDQLAHLLEEIADLHLHKNEFSELLIKSNLYKICAHILQVSMQNATDNTVSRSLRDIAKIEKALDVIHDKFADPLTVEQVATLCGYSNSNFCKIFKNITGDTFHNVLNRHRIENACCFLQGSNMSVEHIASHVGFTDSKSFCRVFKSFIGVTPGTYRRQNT